MQRKFVAILDTNVLVSGLLSPNGIPGTIVTRFRNGEFDIVTSRQQLREIRAVLRRPSLAKALPKGTLKQVLQFFTKLKALTKTCKPPSLDWDFRDAGDHFLLDLVAFARPDFLVTGDKALLSLGTVQKTKIVSPSEFVERL